MLNRKTKAINVHLVGLSGGPGLVHFQTEEANSKGKFGRLYRNPTRASLKRLATWAEQVHRELTVVPTELGWMIWKKES